MSWDPFLTSRIANAWRLPVIFVKMSGVYDRFFREVARELSNRGAEIIAWPVWGCNPEQARARACEKQVYLVSSTYEDVSRDWMLTANPATTVSAFS